MRNGGEYWRAKNYNLYYDIQLSNKLSENSEVLSISVKSNIQRIVSYYLLNKTPITCSKLGYGNIYVKNKDLVETGKTAALRHTTKDFSKLNETIKILEEIIDWASQNNTEIIFYTTPAYTTYVSNLNADQLELTRKTITNLVENNTNCSYFNLLEDPDFFASDFSDADHLNQEGAKKLSKKLDELISAPQK